MSEDFWSGLALGLVLCSVIMFYREKLYRDILQQIGDTGGSEKINGVWYQITREGGMEP